MSESELIMRASVRHTDAVANLPMVGAQTGRQGVAAVVGGEVYLVLKT